MGQHENWQKRNVKFIVTNYNDLHHKLQLLIRIYFLLDHRLLFLLLTLNMCLFAKKDIAQKLLLF